MRVIGLYVNHHPVKTNNTLRVRHRKDEQETIKQLDISIILSRGRNKENSSNEVLYRVFNRSEKNFLKKLVLLKTHAVLISSSSDFYLVHFHLILEELGTQKLGSIWY